jgi:hypothetical protein
MLVCIGLLIANADSAVAYEHNVVMGWPDSDDGEDLSSISGGSAVEMDRSTVQPGLSRREPATSCSLDLLIRLIRESVKIAWLR